MKNASLIIVCFLLLLSCVGEDLVNDYVDPDLRISNAILSIPEGVQYQFTARFFDESGTKVENPTLVWLVDPPTALSIAQDGTIQAIAAREATVIVQTTGLRGDIIEARTTFSVTAVTSTDTSTSTSETSTMTADSETSTLTTDTETSTMTTETETSTMTTDTETSTMTTETETSTMTTDTETSTMTTETETSTTTIDNNTGTGIVLAPQFYEGEIISTSSYILEGNFRYEHNGTQITLSLDENYRASTSLPGLYLYLGNNPNTVNGAIEIAKVTVFNGAHEYILPPSIELADYKYLIYWCKPFSVPVGEGTIF
ncbi:DM13 domain-containing protein [Flavobacteriaceae bacterium]|nr:DM13 domain-containing protein [Flavobacteriaceae bacterium]